MRINKFLASSGLASRRKAEEYIKAGKVVVNDKVCTNLATDILETDIVKVNGQAILKPEVFEYYMLNKPKGYVCSNKDDRGRKTVINLIDTASRIFSVGRLDYDSEGLLILTNDGDLTYKLTHPKHEIKKTYIVRIEGQISKEEIGILKKGAIIDKGIHLSPCEIQVLSFDDKQTRLEVIIHEGKNREIRKMFESINKNVCFLKRTKIEKLSLGGLNRGEYRKLTNKEINYLKSL